MQRTPTQRRTSASRFHVVLILLGFLAVSCSLLDPPPFDEGKWRQDVEAADTSLLYAPHFEDGKFFNPWMPRKQGGFSRLLRWKLSDKEQYTSEEERYQPVRLPDLKTRIASSTAGGDFIAWVGHSTFLMRLNGEFWMTDPMLSERALLPRRITPPAISAEAMAHLPGRVNVIISHNHYDHLDVPTLRKLPAGSRVFVPLGLKSYVEKFHPGETVELDWWQALEIGNGMRLVCLPAQHWSKRITQSTNSTLWASFLLMSEKAVIYFGGDSGYFPGYKEIGRIYPRIDYALLPITAYHPRWFMHYAHVDAREALDAFEELGARYFIPTQWGTFRLGNEPIGYPVLDLQRTMHARGFDASRVLVLNLGQVVDIPDR